MTRIPPVYVANMFFPKIYPEPLGCLSVCCYVEEDGGVEDASWCGTEHGHKEGWVSVAKEEGVSTLADLTHPPRILACHNSEVAPLLTSSKTASTMNFSLEYTHEHVISRCR